LLALRASVPIFLIGERYFVPPADLFRVSAALFHLQCIHLECIAGARDAARC